jgi:hypothetical protein
LKNQDETYIGPAYPDPKGLLPYTAVSMRRSHLFCLVFWHKLWQL